jgi:hypothetical protein
MAFFSTASGKVFDTAGQELHRKKAERSPHMSSSWTRYWVGSKAIPERRR